MHAGAAEMFVVTHYYASCVAFSSWAAPHSRALAFAAVALLAFMWTFMCLRTYGGWTFQIFPSLKSSKAQTWYWAAFYMSTAGYCLGAAIATVVGGASWNSYNVLWNFFYGLFCAFMAMFYNYYASQSMSELVLQT